VLVEPLNSKTISDLVDSTEEKLGRVSQTPSPLVEPLSRREIEVLQLVAAGLSNREVGERLFLSLDTVKGHNRNIYGKLEVKNRTQAINKAIDLKIISPR
jgi:LuxR family maltose regulon positive regulatory protein